MKRWKKIESGLYEKHPESGKCAGAIWLGAETGIWHWRVVSLYGSSKYGSTSLLTKAKAAANAWINFLESTA